MHFHPRNLISGYTVLRAFLGANLFFHGAVRIGGGVDIFATAVQTQFAATFLPPELVSIFLKALPGAELSLGLMIGIGWKSRSVLCLGSGVLMALVFGMSLLQKWDVVGVQMTYALFYGLLLAFLDLNSISVDGWLQRRGESPNLRFSTRYDTMREKSS